MFGWLSKGARRDAGRLVAEGNRAEQAGDLARACELYRRAVAADPRSAKAQLNLGVALEAAGDGTGAERCYEAALALEPQSWAAAYNLGKLSFTRGQLAPARELLERALAARAEFAEAHLVLGYVAQAAGDDERTLTELEAALRTGAAGAAAAHAQFSIGRILQSRGQSAQALQRFEAALALEPQHVEALSASAALQASLGQGEQARDAYRRLLLVAPERVEAHYNLALVERELGRGDAAMASLRRALELDPALAPAHYALGHVLHAQDRIGEALECFRRAVALDPGFVEARWSIAMAQLPSVYAAEAEPAACRERFAAELGALERWFAAERPPHGERAVGSEQPFALAYQEQDNRELLARYGALCSRLIAEWRSRDAPAPPAHRRGGKRLHVGFVSSYFRSHSVWNSHLKGWLRHLDRERFSLCAFDLGRGEDAQTAIARSAVAQYEAGPRELRAWVDAIQRAAPDVLIYPEVGMDPMCARLAALRLAPVQAASWGHPETSGLPTIDYYLSAEDFEPPEAQAYYTERLVRLSRLGCHFERPASGAGGAAAALVDDGVPLLVCPGVPFKYAPQHDWVLAEIARRLGRCRLVFFTHADGALSQRLAGRLRAAFDARGVDYGRFVTFLPWQPAAGFRALLSRATLYLDTIGFSGFNTALYAVECGLPLVTREGRFMRGRLASGVLKRLGLASLVAPTDGAYVELAVRLAADAGQRRLLAGRMAERRASLYEDMGAVRALEDWLLGAHGAATGRG